MSTHDTSHTDAEINKQQNHDLEIQRQQQSYNLALFCIRKLPFMLVGAFMLWVAAVVIGFDTEADLERMAIANQAAERFAESGSLADAKKVLAIYREFDADTPWNRTQRRETWSLVKNLQSDAVRLGSIAVLIQVSEVQDLTDQAWHYLFQQAQKAQPESATLKDLKGANNAQNN